jgi:hypothetical protein
VADDGGRPVLKLGRANDHDWVTQAQELLTRARSPMDLEDVPVTGTYDQATEQAVLAFQAREGLSMQDGVVGPETWGALYEALDRHQQANAVAAQHDQDVADSHGTAPVEAADPPPTLAEVDHGRELLDYYVDEIVAKATAFAEKVKDMGPADEVLPKLLDAAHTGAVVGEIFELTESAVFVGGATGLTILAPLAMWYEAIGANDAGELHALRWHVFHPFMSGFWAGLYDQAPGAVDELFQAVATSAHATASSFSESQKKGIRAILLGVGGGMDIPDESNPTISPEHWALSGPNTSYTWNGLETSISHHGG